MDVHIFYKMFWQVVLLAVFGLAVATALSGVMAKMVFVDYHWTWFEALLFGSIVSATDPVAVVALLNDLGESIGLCISQGWFSIECRETKPKPIAYQLDYSAISNRSKTKIEVRVIT